MKILKGIIVGIGLVALVAAAVFIGLSVIDINQMHAVAQANRSAGYPNPRSRILLTIGLSAASAFLLGLGLGLPTRLRGKEELPAQEPRLDDSPEQEFPQN